MLWFIASHDRAGLKPCPRDDCTQKWNRSKVATTWRSKVDTARTSHYSGVWEGCEILATPSKEFAFHAPPSATKERSQRSGDCGEMSCTIEMKRSRKTNIQRGYLNHKMPQETPRKSYAMSNFVDRGGFNLIAPVFFIRTRLFRTSLKPLHIHLYYPLLVQC
jgi:hypothetical protein